MYFSLPMSSYAGWLLQVSCIASEAALSWQIDKHLCQNEFCWRAGIFECYRTNLGKGFWALLFWGLLTFTDSVGMLCLCLFCPCADRGVLIGSLWHEGHFNFLADFVTGSTHSDFQCYCTERGGFIAEAEKMNIKKLLAKRANNTVCIACIWYAHSFLGF